MADYYPLLARAIGGLPDNSVGARTVIYERARRALLNQLRSADPPLSEDDISREQSALEGAIRRLEADYGKQAASAGGVAESKAPGGSPVESEAKAPAAARDDEDSASLAPGEPEDEAPAASRTPASYEGFGPVRGEIPVNQTKHVDQDSGHGRSDDEDDLYAAALGAPAHGGERWAPPLRDRDFNDHSDADTASVEPSAGSHESESVAPALRGRGRLIGVAVLGLLLIAGAVVGYTQRDTIVALLNGQPATSTATETAAQQPANESEPGATKSTDRIAQVPADGTRTAPSSASANSAPQQGVGVAQRAVFFEESPGGGQQGLQQYVGTVVWGTETYTPGDGGAPDIGITAKVAIPDRNIDVTLRLRRNQDASIPASHIVDVQFDIPPDFDLGEVSNVPGMRAKAVEGASGAPLTGISVKVGPSYFLIGLSSLQSDIQRNLGLLITRNWLDIPTVFEGGRRAILVLEKGTPGDQAFRQAFSAWGLPLPPQGEPVR